METGNYYIGRYIEPVSSKTWKLWSIPPISDRDYVDFKWFLTWHGYIRVVKFYSRIKVLIRAMELLFGQFLLEIGNNRRYIILAYFFTHVLSNFFLIVIRIFYSCSFLMLNNWFFIIDGNSILSYKQIAYNLINKISKRLMLFQLLCLL